ncbi:hypothetical protein HNR46_004222 [Haloferula luteola]|uniref:AMIN domain-containing protein n=2 Tax=Haloferula luteola TaxID=595692 RepID=A0A840V7J6_9BACT|nr:hypothetical protein [Haloferula luteola]
MPLTFVLKIMFLRIAIVLFVGVAFGGSRVAALDAPAPPAPKTLAWTVKQANRRLPTVDFTGTRVDCAIELLGSSMTLPGYYLKIDASKIQERFDRKLDLHLKDVRWIEVMGAIADAVDAKLVIEPGLLRFVPRGERMQPARTE